MKETSGKTNKRPGLQNRELLQALPKVDEALGWLAGLSDAPVRRVKTAVREVIDDRRQAILAGGIKSKNELSRGSLTPAFLERIARKQTPNLRRVINATGVVIHTNLGRSVLPPAVMAAVMMAGTSYSNLEFDLETGRRGSRYSLVEDLLCELTGAEAALVVNNNAAAVLLVLNTLALDREVIVSRGQLVEIGGSFRIPEVMARSGARLVEVGATNRTHLHDYAGAMTDDTAMLLKVHASNFRITGFTKEVPLAELVTLARDNGLMVMEDLGSGCLVDLSRFGLEKEPTVIEVLQSGADVVTCSGDKLLGGPQAGIILGRKEIIERVKKNQLNRALRIDKFTLAALEQILRLYFDEELALKTIPTLMMLSMPAENILARARMLHRKIKKALAGVCRTTVEATGSRVGGGALPEQNLPSHAVCLVPTALTVNQLEEGLRRSRLPVIGRIEDDRYLLDLRTVADNEVPLLEAALVDFFAATSS